MEKNSSLVTILCSTFNSARWIRGYLESINNQLLPEFDIIFVDANSQDGSLNIIKDYTFREGISKKVIECEKRISVYEAWNVGIKDSTTPYVINVNTDDRLYRGALSTYLTYAQSYPNVDVFYGSCNVVKEENHLAPAGLYYWPEYSHATLIQQCICGPFPLLKRQTIVDEGLFDPVYNISGDYEMWLRLSKRGKKFLKVAETVGSFYYNPEGISSQNSPDWNEHVRQDMELRQRYQ